jgi:RecB family endonuclease NucS
VWRQEGGIYAGIPDIIGYDKFGVFVAIEVKIENGKLTPLQEIFLSKLRTTPHGKAYVVRIYDGHFRANEFQQRR